MPDKPKAFLSYSWTSRAHRELIRGYAERLMSDGVDVILDQWDLKEGQDKNSFMEKMVTDNSVSHVLVFSDATYAAKADQRKAGVGTESQIISQEVYKRVDQQKFIPIACAVDENEEPVLPKYMAGRIAINFSTPEAVNENWEKLIRVLFGKPLHEKPSVGQAPSYILAPDNAPASPTIGKLANFRTALLQGRPGIHLYRNDLLQTALDFADRLRVRERPNVESLANKVETDLRILLPIRDDLVEWLLLEAQLASENEFGPVVIETLEKILALRYRPPEVTSWDQTWSDAHRIFVYEFFIYTVAALLETKRFVLLHELFSTNYLLPDSEQNRGRQFELFDQFYGYSEVLAHRNKVEKRRRLSPIADLLKQRATRRDLDFVKIMQAELMILLATLIHPRTRWYPQTLIYAGYGRRFPFFIRAAQHKHFKHLATITGISSGDALRAAVKAGMERIGADQWIDFRWHTDVSLVDAMNLEALDTVD
jgi:hypothetical protein